MRIPTRLRTRERRGAAAVELAMVIPVFMLVVFGMIDFTRAYFFQAALSGAVHEGARYAGTLDDPSGTEAAKVKLRVRAALASSTTTAALDTSKVLVVSGTSVDSVRVTINNYPYTLTTPLRRLIGLTGTSVNFTRSATFGHEIYQ